MGVAKDNAYQRYQRTADLRVQTSSARNYGFPVASQKLEHSVLAPDDNGVSSTAGDEVEAVVNDGRYLKCSQ